MKSDWHLDRAVPLGLILAMVGQIAMGAWFASRLESRVTAVEVALDDRSRIMRQQADQIIAINERTIRMEEQLKGVSANMTSIERYMRERSDDGPGRR